MWGRLTWSAIPIDQPIVIGASAVVGIGIVLVERPARVIAANVGKSRHGVAAGPVLTSTKTPRNLRSVDCGSMSRG